MASTSSEVEKLIPTEYAAGFYTDIEQDTVAPGLDEGVIRFISAKKEEPQYMLDWRLAAFAQWQKMREPNWANVHHEPIDYQSISYYSAPKSAEDAPKSLDDVDPKLLETYEKLGIPRMALFSARSPKPRVSTPNWCRNTSAPWSPQRIIFSRH